MNQAIDDLKNEHQAVNVALQILQGMSQRLAAGGVVPPEDVRALGSFFREFVDKCHHGKEELHLFSALQAAQTSATAGSVAGLLQDHVDGRKWLQEVEASAGPVLDTLRFTEAASRYTELLRGHIQQEESVVFPQAEQLLNDAAQARLYEAFVVHEDQVIGAGRHEELHTLLHRLGETYRSPVRA